MDLWKSTGNILYGLNNEYRDTQNNGKSNWITTNDELSISTEYEKIKILRNFAVGATAINCFLQIYLRYRQQWW